MKTKIAILALAFTGLSTVALAEPSAALRSACMSDAMRLCDVFKMSMDQVGACLIAKRSQTSPKCQAAYDAETKGDTKKSAQK